MWLSNVIIHVWPSAGALAAIAAPIAPAAPGLLSITVCQPVLSLTLAARMRATGSVVPPGGKGTTTRMEEPFGQSLACARARRGAASAAVAERSVRRRMVSVSLDVVVLDDLEPALLFALLVGGELLGRGAEDLHVELLDEFLGDVGRSH